MLSFYDRAKAMIRSADPVEVAAVKSANQGILSCKGVSGAIHVNQTLSNLSIQYANQAFIGLQLMPLLNCAKTSGNFKVYGKSDRLAVPDDTISKRGRANEVSETRTDDTYTCVGRALENFVDEQDLMDQDAPLNEMLDLTQSVNDGLDLAEELRIATVLTTTGNFGGNTATLTGSDRWDSSTGGNPVKNIQDARNALWMGLGATKVIGYSSLGVFSVLQRHPAILDLFKNVTAGLAT